MNQFKKLFSAHLKNTFREKQVWFWSIFYPVILLVIFLTIFSGSESEDFKAKIAVVSESDTPVSRQLEQVLHAIPVLEWRDEAAVPMEQAEEWLKGKKVEGVVVLPDGVTSKEVRLMVNRENEVSPTTQRSPAFFAKSSAGSNGRRRRNSAWRSSRSHPAATICAIRISC